MEASLPAHSEHVAAREGEAGRPPEARIAAARGEGSARRRAPAGHTTFEPKLVFETRNGAAWSYDASIGAVFGDRGINRYFYEVQPQYATATRPVYGAGAGLMLVRAGLSGSYRLNNDVRLFGYVREESYAGAAKRDSPLMKKNSGASIGAGVMWTLGRSSQPARGRE